VLSALRFRQEVKRHPELWEDGPPLTLACSDMHLETEG
jgi:uncharacterized protein (DUF2252 family)